MLIIPAVDIRDGRCVRLVHGELDKETVYYEDPVEAALHWEAEGAGRLHLVDLDGAFDGKMKNARVIERIVSAVKVPVQVGGGIRDISLAEDLFSRGVARVILGTVAVTNPDVVEKLCALYPGQVIAGIDAKAGVVAIKGWVQESDLQAIDLAHKMAALGVQEIVYTDIGRDGTLGGPNIAALQEMAMAAKMKVIASGGVSSLQDIKDLLALECHGISGVIVGQALYAKRFRLPEALALQDGEEG